MNAAIFPRALLMVFLALAFPVASFAHWDVGVGVTVGFAPPEIPLYTQPPCPATGYIWTPGYWAYSGDDEDYYWVPGTWVLAPSPGLLWTPGYWAVIDDDYVWHEGYWAPHVGFYGGINYGFGYFGVGFAGGYWRDRDFYYNRAVTNVTNVSVTNVYNSTVINNRYDGSRASFNGGNGTHARPTPAELIAAREPHRGFTPPQRLQAESARKVPGLLASANHGHPSVAATARPGLFNAARSDAPSHRSIPRQPLPAHALNQNQPAVTHSTGAQGNPRSTAAQANSRARDGAQHSAPPSSTPAIANYRRSEPHPAAVNAARPTAYRSAPAATTYQRPEPHPAAVSARPTPYRPAPTATTNRQVPSYTAPRQVPPSSYTTPRAPQSTPRSESYTMRPNAASAPVQRNETGSRGAPPVRGSAQAPMQDRRRS